MDVEIISRALVSSVKRQLLIRFADYIWMLKCNSQALSNGYSYVPTSNEWQNIIMEEFFDSTNTGKNKATYVSSRPSWTIWSLLPVDISVLASDTSSSSNTRVLWYVFLIVARHWKASSWWEQGLVFLLSLDSWWTIPSRSYSRDRHSDQWSKASP